MIFLILLSLCCSVLSQTSCYSHVNGRYCGDDGVLNECQCGLLFNVTSDTFGYRNCYNDTVTDCEYGCHEIKVRCRYETEQCSSNFTDLLTYAPVNPCRMTTSTGDSAGVLSSNYSTYLSAFDSTLDRISYVFQYVRTMEDFWSVLYGSQAISSYYITLTDEVSTSELDNVKSILSPPSSVTASTDLYSEINQCLTPSYYTTLCAKEFTQCGRIDSVVTGVATITDVLSEAGLDMVVSEREGSLCYNSCLSTRACLQIVLRDSHCQQIANGDISIQAWCIKVSNAFLDLPALQCRSSCNFEPTISDSQAAVIEYMNSNAISQKPSLSFWLGLLLTIILTRL